MKKSTRQKQLIILVLLSAGSISAQQLTPFVISSSGGFYENSSGMLSFTTGEMTAVETFTASASILTQGFQQSYDLGTYVTERPDQHFSFGTYPNPSNGNFDLVTETDVSKHLAVHVMDIFGREIFRTEFDQQHGINVRSFDLSDVSPGMYFLALTAKETQSKHESQYVVKIQIIR
ncbi:MAG TPA: T9SS type A sorting domain-containing protein [Saprospiraceae bacterium]|nr:T9SS type A sorting domain-containing protein [Saprospiraceae bacterium]